MRLSMCCKKSSCPSLTRGSPALKRPPGPVLFKSCGWAGWDLAAARLALRHASPALAAMDSVTATPA